MKAATLESRFPVQTVENGCIISKDADITVVYAVELPELFTVASAEYEAIHSAWAKAIKVLPDYTVILKQDWFEKENYRPDMQRSDDMSYRHQSCATNISRFFIKYFQQPFHKRSDDHYTLQA